MAAFVRAEKRRQIGTITMTAGAYETDILFIMNLRRARQREFAIRTVLRTQRPPPSNVDYASMELLHAKLVRTTTCVERLPMRPLIRGDKDPYLKRDILNTGMRRASGGISNALQVILEGASGWAFCHFGLAPSVSARARWAWCIFTAGSQNRCVTLRLQTKEERINALIFFKAVCVPGYIACAGLRLCAQRRKGPAQAGSCWSYWGPL